ncbi:MAG: nicotinate (nicotinamide) nucleotide adenylyltransferase [Chlamydiales bacterium]|nr:nicotinate (nicotinamide) nucleotide adenylyltransferase [Chlamydiales bacterium]
MKNKIGFFGGTFDPIHIGHIQLALCLMEQAQLSKVVFCPTALSPFKGENPPAANGKHRLAMLSLALQDIPSVEIIENEIHADFPSYTIDTIIQLKKNVYQQNTIRLLLSQETAQSLSLWKEYKKLIEIAPPLVGCRQIDNTKNSLHLEMVQTPLFDISSTTIRNRIKEKKYVGHLLSQAVLQYIKTHRLYL